MPDDCYVGEKEYWNIDYERMWSESFSWSEKQPAILVLLATLTNNSFYEDRAKSWFEYLKGNDPYSSVTPGYTPAGLLIYNNWPKKQVKIICQYIVQFCKSFNNR